MLMGRNDSAEDISGMYRCTVSGVPELTDVRWRAHR